MIKRTPSCRQRARLLAFTLALVLATIAFAVRAQDQPPSKRPSSSRWAGSGLKSWAEMRAEAKAYPAKQMASLKKSIRSLRIVGRPHTVLQSYDPEPELWRGLTAFYDLLKGRELDMYAEQPGIPELFPNRESYYDFLDTIIPAMRDRAFERNRLLSYRIHAIKTTPDGADVTISITSDDSLKPLHKSMIFHQAWTNLGYHWYPGKISAEPATVWERIK